MKNFWISFFSLVSIISLNAQNADVEFRASWVATVFNIDWPTVKNNPELQKQELIEILDSARQTNMNAILLQIRPNADALYNSSIEPWSEWLTGTRGQDPGYDPLAFAIEKGHEMGIEVHGWINPYRFETEAGRYSGKAGDFKDSHPEWILEVEGKTYFNPGVPEVAQYIKEVIGEIVNNYDIDGLCFDDYFYPSGISNEDNDEFTTYGESGESKGDFRRRSVNQMIAEVYDTIQQIKPYLRFGVSPAGIYSMDARAAAQYNTTLPAGIVGRDNYNAIYCDALAWMKMGIVDYISPQLYWKIGGSQDYFTLLDWWSAEADKYGVDCFPSLASYRLSRTQPVVDAADGWANSEVINQIKHTRTQRDQGAQGIIFYKQSDVETVTSWSKDLQSDVFSMPALWPEFANSDAPQLIANGVVSRWQESGIAGFEWESENNVRYIVESFDAESNRTAHQVRYVADIALPVDTITVMSLIYPINRYGKWNAQSIEIEVPVVSKPTLLRLEGGVIASADDLTWNYADNASVYVLEIASDSGFENIWYQSDLLTDTSMSVNDLGLMGDDSFYWRVKACNGKGCEYSDTDSFKTGFPPAVAILLPSFDDIHVALEANIAWTMVDGVQSYEVELSKDSNFFNPDWVWEVNNQTMLTTPSLSKWQDYFVRVRAVNGFGKGAWSPFVSFKTTTDVPTGPLFISPEQDSDIASSSVEVSWEKTDFATGYRVLLSNDTSFSTNLIDTLLSSYTRKLDVELSPNQQYYVKVCATYVGGCGGWSEVLHFTQTLSSRRELALAKISVFPNPVQDVLHVAMSPAQLDRIKISEVQIFSVLGRLVFSERLSMNIASTPLDVSRLSDGMYFVKMVNKEGQVVALSRFVKD